MDLTGNINTTEMENIIKELNTWCLNYRGFVNQIFSSQVTMEEKVTQLFWVVKKVCESQIDVMNNYNDLYNYVVEYFKKSDFQEEIDAAVNYFFTSGEGQKYLNTWSLLNKKVIWFGDSLTYGDSGLDSPARVEKPIPDRFSELTGAICVNAGKNGAQASTYGNPSNTLKAQLESTDVTDADYIMLEFGTNDFNGNVGIGDVDSETWSLFCGAFNNAIDYIYQRNKTAVIIILGLYPSHRYFFGSYNSYRANIFNIDEALRAISRYNHIRYIDILRNCSITEESVEELTTDGTHFTQAGYDIICDTIIRNFGGNYPYSTPINNFFNKNSYPQYYNPYNYYCVYGGTSSTWLSYNEYSFEKGRYMIDFDYHCELSGLDQDNYHAGIQFLYTGSIYIVSPTGLKNGDGHVRVMFTVFTAFTGNIAFRFTTNDPNCVPNNVYIKNLTISPVGDYEGNLKGEITTSPYTTFTDEDGKFNTALDISRFEDGGVQVSYAGGLTAAVNANQALSVSSYFRRVVNVDKTVSFPMFVTRDGDVQIFKGYLIGSTITCASNLLADDGIEFSFIN